MREYQSNLRVSHALPYSLLSTLITPLCRQTLTLSSSLPSPTPPSLTLPYTLPHSFYDECKRRYNIKLWKTFTDCFNCLPVAAIVDEKIFCMHGGLSPELQNMEQIKRIMRPTDIPDTGTQRPLSYYHYHYSLLTSLLL